jgi:hypothetical protein
MDLIIVRPADRAWYQYAEYIRQETARAIVG